MKTCFVIAGSARGLAHLTNAVWAGKDPEWGCPVYEACELAIKDDSCRVKPWDKGRSMQPVAWGRDKVSCPDRTLVSVHREREFFNANGYLIV